MPMPGTIARICERMASVRSSLVGVVRGYSSGIIIRFWPLNILLFGERARAVWGGLRNRGCGDGLAENKFAHTFQEAADVGDRPGILRYEQEILSGLF